MAPAAVFLIGAAMSAGAAVHQGMIAKKQGDFQEKLAEHNQDALERQAKAERDAARFDEGRIARRQKLVEAAQMAGAAKSGVGLAGSSINVLADTAFQFSLDRNLRLRQGVIKGQELKDRGNVIMAEGKFAKSVGKAKQTAGFIQAGGSILSSYGAMGMGGGGDPTNKMHQFNYTPR